MGATAFPQNAGYNPTDTVGALAYWAAAAPKTSDLVRLLTISDIFAALIESRPYSPAISKCLRNSVRHGWKTGAIACEGVPECRACSVKQIRGSRECFSRSSAGKEGKQGLNELVRDCLNEKACEAHLSTKASRSNHANPPRTININLCRRIESA
jgi:hypothetical protein